MDRQDGLGAMLEEALEHGRALMKRELQEIRADLAEVLHHLVRGGLLIGTGSALAVAGAATVGLVALTEPSPSRARMGYALGMGALALASGLVGLGMRTLPEAPLRELEERVAEDLSKALPH